MLCISIVSVQFVIPLDMFHVLLDTCKNERYLMGCFYVRNKATAFVSVNETL